MTLTPLLRDPRSRTVAALFPAVILCLCILSSSGSAQTIDLNFNFRDGDLGWTAGFANYHTTTNGMYELDAGIRFAPRKLTRVPIRAFYLQGHSRSASLIMFLKRRLTASDGIVAGQRYQIEYVIKLASMAPTGCVGIGSPPGEGVFLRAGGSSLEPVTVLQPNGWYGLNIDFWTATSAAGNIANGLECEIAYPVLPFVYIARNTQHTSVRATPQGDLWLFAGTGSGFEGLTRLYYQNIQVRLIPVSTP